MIVRRKEILGKINDRQKLSITEYTAIRVLADATIYYNACNLIEGLEELNDAAVLDVEVDKSEKEDGKNFGEALMELRTNRLRDTIFISGA